MKLNVRKGWTETNLGDVADVIMGRQLSPSKKMGTRPRPYLRAANIGNWGISLDDVLEMDFTEDEENHFANRIGDVLLVEGGNEKSVGCPALVTEREEGLCIQNTIIRCRVKGASNLSPEFLYHFLRYSFWAGKFGELCAGTTIMHLGQKRAAVFPLVLPPLEEQKRIVDVMSSVDTYIDSLQKQADSARIARNAVLHDLLSAGGDDWTETTLGEVADTRLGKMLSATTDDGTGEMRPYLRNTNVRWGEVDLSDLKEMRFSKKDCETFSLLAGDLLICEGGEPGRAALLKNDLAGIYFQKAIHRVRCKEGLEPEFLAYWMQHLTRSELLDNFLTSTTIKHLTGEKLRQLPILMPPPTEQRGIVEIVSSVDGVIQSTEKAVVDAKNLRSGLLSDLLSGEHEIPATYDLLLKVA